MKASFNKKELFTKGIEYAEFFNVGNNNLLGFSSVVTDFGMDGSYNEGAIEGGPGNQLIMLIPDTARLSITAKTADSDLNNMALPLGANVTGNGIIETSDVFTGEGNKITLNGRNACAPYGGNKAVAYVINSTGTDKAEVQANSGTAYTVASTGVVEGFTAEDGASYCVKFFTRNSSAEVLTIPGLFAPAVVRAHFAINVYAKDSSGDAMKGSLYARRHYYIPRYSFTAGLKTTENQTTPGSVDLSGMALSYADAMSENVCAGSDKHYGYIVDEILGDNSSTAAVDGIYFIGLGDGVTISGTGEVTLPVKYSVNGALADISDMSQVTFSTPDQTHAKFTDSHQNVITGVTTGETTATVSVTNSATGVEYKDIIAVNVTA